MRLRLRPSARTAASVALCHSHSARALSPLLAATAGRSEITLTLTLTLAFTLTLTLTPAALRAAADCSASAPLGPPPLHSPRAQPDHRTDAAATTTTPLRPSEPRRCCR
jgi:hypothetical protein